MIYTDLIRPRPSPLADRKADEVRPHTSAIHSLTGSIGDQPGRLMSKRQCLHWGLNASRRHVRTSARRLKVAILPIDPETVNTIDMGTNTIHKALASMISEATLVSVNPSHGLSVPLR